MTGFRKTTRRDPAAPLRPREAWKSSFDAFLGTSLVSERFSIDGRVDEDYEIVWDASYDEDPFAVLPDGYAIHLVQDWEPDTVVLLAPSGDMVGFYMGGQLWVDPGHRGAGRGSEMILALTEATGASPTRHLGGLGYSPAGMAAHERAWRTAVTRAVEAGLKVDPRIAACVQDDVATSVFARRADRGCVPRP